MNVQLTGIDVRFGAIRALSQVDAGFASGRVSVLAGPNGAGKSTLMGVLLGLVHPQAGAMTVEGRAVSLRRGTPRWLRQQIGYLPEAVAFAESATGRRVLRFFAAARGAPRSEVEAVLQRVGLADAAGRAVRGYSRGMRQRLGLGAAILGAPPVLVLDEPTGGLDQQGLDVLWQVLAEWREAGRTVIVATHDLTLAERRVDHVLVLAEGRCCAAGSPDELRARVDLPVTVRLAFRDAATASGWASRVRARDAVLGLEQRDALVLVSTPSRRLFEVLKTVNGEAEAIENVRVEEPGFDDVYQAVLNSTLASPAGP